MLDQVFLLFLGFAAAMALAYGIRFVVGPPSGPATLTKTAAVAALALAGGQSGASALIVAGLALGACGDFCLSRPGKVAFLVGMGAFGLGHLAYATAFWHAAGVSLVTVLPVLVLALSTEVWLAPHTGDLRWPVRAYVLIISAMVIAALSLGGAQIRLCIGVGLFLLSDMLLALDLFVLGTRDPPRALLKRLLWASYWTAQALILTASLHLPAAPAPLP